MESSSTGLEVAVVGMAGQFPGADNVSEFWTLLRNGSEGVSSFSANELKASGVPEDIFTQENYVPVKGVINQPYHFAADYFGVHHADATRMDPQIRLMIESCWQALNHAGIEPKNYAGKVGIFAGGSSQWSWFNELNTQFSSTAEQFHVATLNDPSFCTRISWLLNLRGPSVTLQTACSTSLVAIHMACQALQAGECEVALAGGVSVTHPHRSGYLWQEGMINSPDGKTRVFDEQACGTVFSNGVGVVALKRLDDAINNGDRIFAIIKGSAVNNDGGDKISFTAPSELGQQGVISDALDYAEVGAEQISYIEAHGTGTLLGDPIEVAALKRIFHRSHECALGSVKSNVGHCDAAAGVTSFIKVVLCAYFKTLVPSLHVNRINPKLDLENSPFYVNTETKPWPANDRGVRMAGVSAFGVGGTNAHIIVQDYPGHEAPSNTALLYQTLPNRQEFRVASSTTCEQLRPEPVATVRQNSVPPDLPQALLDTVQDHFAKTSVLPEDNFFDIGASSLDITQLHSKINAAYGLNLKLSDYYRYPNCGKLARYIGDQQQASAAASNTPYVKKTTPHAAVSNSFYDYPQHAIAVVGVSGRFPGSENIDTYWRNLLAGQEGISFFSDEELLAAGVPQTSLKMKNYIKAKGVLADSFAFDADAFSYSARESQYMDPQLRLLHEAVWQVLDDAGYGNQKYRPVTGLFASCGSNHAWLERLKSEISDPTEQFGVALLNDREFLTTRIAYKLNLTGPAVTVQSACSSSALAITLACQSLRSAQCDLALAGGVSVTTPVKSGYLYMPGMINSVDGHCRPFSSEASGTVFSDGVGMVALKRLEDALRDNDNLYGVISGFGVNNDGNDKTGYTAPNASGQANCIRQSLRMAEVEASDIEFIEAHGTATLIGDEIEIEGLKEAIGGAESPCVLGSVKSNIGHTNTAAGVASFIKAVLALKHNTLPMSCHVTDTIPASLADSRFSLIKTSRQWRSDDKVKSAGVSSFGIGGTNVHLTVQSIVPQKKLGKDRSELIVLSSKCRQGLEQTANALRDALQTMSDNVNLTDLAYTLQLGRGEFPVRAAIVTEDIPSLIDELSRLADGEMQSCEVNASASGVVFMFPGQGSQYVAMAQGWYQELPEFKRIVDECHAHLLQNFDIDLLALLYGEGDEDSRAQALQNTYITQPIIFVVSYALAKSLEHFGIRASAMIGHSIGEYVAASLAGVMTLTEALTLVASRGRIMQACQPGAMLSVAASRDEVMPFLTDDVTLATVNSPVSCVIAGPIASLNTVQTLLEANHYRCRLLKTSHAFHTAMMQPGVAAFRTELEKVAFNTPQSGFLSNVSGNWITPEEACSVEYWINHLCQPVEFQRGIEACLQLPKLNVFLEVGPGRTLSTFVRQIAGSEAKISVLNLLRHPLEEISDRHCLLSVLGELWTRGETLAWPAFYQSVSAGRISLPGYQFVDTIAAVSRDEQIRETRLSECAIMKKPVTEWLYNEQWQPITLHTTSLRQANAVLCFAPDLDWCDRLREHFTASGQQVRFVVPAAEYCVSDKCFGVVPGERESFNQLLSALSQSDFVADTVVFAWPLGETTVMKTCWFSVIALIQAWGASGITTPFRLLMVKAAVAEQALFNGLVKVIAQEVPKCCPRLLEVMADARAEQVCAMITEELCADDARLMVKRTPQARFEKCYQPVVNNSELLATRFRQQGVYLITGGLGDLGELFARYLMTRYDARVILVGRRVLPPQDTWALVSSQGIDAEGVAKLSALMALGVGEVEYYAADVCNKKEMGELLEAIKARYGVLNGVICAAGITRGDSFQGINHLTLCHSQPQFDTKVSAFQVLSELLADQPIDFCLLCSSIAAILGGLSFSAYSSVSAFADSFAQEQNRQGRPWVSVNWDGWIFERRQAGDALGSSLEQLLIEPEEGLAILERILQVPLNGQVIVSTGDLNQRFNQWVGNHVRPFVYDSRVTQAKSGLTQQQVFSTIVDICKDFLKISEIEGQDNFFKLGANSLDLVQINQRITDALVIDLSVVDMFSYPTPEALANFIIKQNSVAVDAASVEPEVATPQVVSREGTRPLGSAEINDNHIAIIGMAGSFPGAENIHDFWQNLTQGKESLSTFSKEELLEEGIDAELLAHPGYVKMKGVFPHVGEFDAEFFGYTPFEARQMDPQVRAFHTACWQALQDARISPAARSKKIGLYAAASGNLQWLAQAMTTAEGSAGQYSTMTVADKDYMATSVAYKLNLTGPALVLSTACSSSLVAVNEAIQSLKTGACDIALAGGVSITLPAKSGYLAEEGMIHSAEGHCRPFDILADGTVFGDGVGVVVLKPLRQALQDNDAIYATIVGSATNNDGANKVGFTAPSSQGQTAVIQEALKDARISAESLSFVEAHGTGTHLGDPIEFRALRQAFATDKRNYCKLGSVKSNIGHLNAAAGIAGLIKAALSLKYKELPASINFSRINAEIDIANSPFVINNQYSQLDDSAGPLRAGVSSFGIGGTNAHLILEQAPAMMTDVQLPDDIPLLPLMFSAQDEASLDSYRQQIKRVIECGTDTDHINAVALSLLQREVMPCLFVACASDRESLLRRLDMPPSDVVLNHSPATERRLVFLFPGQGMQYAAMGRDLYRTNTLFKHWCERGFVAARGHCATDLQQLFLVDEDDTNWFNTEYAQPIIFIVEYALVQLLASWGVKPSAMIGHSLGEYVAAAVAGVFSFEDAVRMVCTRGRLMNATEQAAMLSVMCSLDVAESLLCGGLDVALDNSSGLCVIAGSEEEISTFAQRCAQRDIKTRYLKVNRAFHSRTMEPILADYAQVLETITFAEPSLPVVSNVTGQLCGTQTLNNADYWVRQIREPVRFTEGLRLLLEDKNTLFLEVGPGKGLTSLVKSHSDFRESHICLSLIGPERDETSSLMETLGMLSMLRVNVDWNRHLPLSSTPPINIPPQPLRGKAYPADVKLLQAIFSGNSTASVERPNDEQTGPAQTLKAIWKNVLGVNDIRAEDDFLSLGGNSLSAVQVIAKAKSAGMALNINMLLSQTSLHQLQRQVGASETSPEAAWRYNTGFKPEFYDISASCIYSAAREALKHNYGLSCSDGVMRAADGSLLLGLTLTEESGGMQLSNQQHYGELFGWPTLMQTFSFSFEKRFLADLTDYSAYCLSELEQGRLVIITGSDYYLPFSPSYGLSKSEYLQRPLFDDITVDEDELIPHAFVLVGRTEGGYQVYDGSFGYFGEISEQEFSQTAIGFRGLDFMQASEVYQKSRPWLVISLSHSGTFPSQEELATATLTRTLSDLQAGAAILDQTGKQHYIGMKAIDRLLEEPERLMAMSVEARQRFIQRWASQLALLERLVRQSTTARSSTLTEPLSELRQARDILSNVDEQSVSAALTGLRHSLKCLIDSLM
ncbi:polyketide synthase [Pectobacterium odoriferum]|uniref:Polyketide synthase n=1 Tax=Pectobacterium odoriferum TaxID=78398 RepID=A0ABD6VK65_9GAMM|nr:type I polyketide synthase [Pectobacterium odoriferum]POD91451.1 polyketide synthase [Pectobacterium odoriferum]POE08868.1 polyketide synthase [Pectobacterium odoriferum]POE23295.1 polyketide synthase [Pectobacterium odoriferum]POE27957.1 polyketide synthase [Pectobacterium odoriferum]POE37523.1 polyketide synthase [Pectobacterium odoriferum]